MMNHFVIASALLILCFMVKHQSCEGFMIDPMQPDVQSKVFALCLKSGDPLIVKNPFESELAENKNFKLMQWKRAKNGDEESLLKRYPSRMSNVPVIELDRISLYEFWGFKLDPVNLDDTAVYVAAALFESRTLVKKLNIVITEPPILASKKLTVTKKKIGNETILSCGQIQSLGTPSVSLFWKTDNGTTLPSQYVDGFLNLKITADMDDGTLQCGVDETSPGMRCIPEIDYPKWDTSYVIASSKASSADTSTLIIAICVGGGILILIIIITVIVLVLRKRKKDSTYNTKHHEEQADISMDDPHRTSLLSGDEPNAPAIPSKGPKASPYMVTGLKMPGMDSHYASSPTNKNQEVPANMKRFEIIEPDNTKKNGQHEEKKPPAPKPRNVFLNSSRESLDKAGRGGQQAPGTQV